MRHPRPPQLYLRIQIKYVSNKENRSFFFFKAKFTVSFSMKSWLYNDTLKIWGRCRKISAGKSCIITSQSSSHVVRIKLGLLLFRELFSIQKCKFNLNVLSDGQHVSYLWPLVWWQNVSVCVGQSQPREHRKLETFHRFVHCITQNE